jgi:hypothetical protein
MAYTEVAEAVQHEVQAVLGFHLDASGTAILLGALLLVDG